MGAGASVNEASSTEEIAEGIAGLGSAFEGYATLVRDNGIDGELLKSYNRDHNADSLLDDLQVTNKLHRKKFVLALEKTFVDKNDSGEGGKEEGAVEEAAGPAPSLLTDPLAELAELAAKIEPKSLSDSVQMDEVNHIFISYRQATETQLATRLYNGTKAIVADRDFAVAGKKPKIFFDRKSLGDGEKWEEGFVHGILNSLILLPLISWEGEDDGSMGQLMNLTSENDRVDNVLLEWDLALVLLDLAEESANKGGSPSLMRSIFPVLIGGTDERGFLPFPFHKLGNLSTEPSLKTKKRLVQICVEHGIPISTEAVYRSVRDVVGRITENQGVKLEDLGKEEVAIEACAERIFDKGSQVLLDVGLRSSPSSKGIPGGAVPEAYAVVPALPSAPSIPGEVNSSVKACLSKVFSAPTTGAVSLGQLAFGAPFSVECIVDIKDVTTAKMYARLWDLEDVVCFTNGGVKDNVKHGIYRVKLNNDNKFCICTSEGFLKNDQRRHLVFTCSADGTRRLYGDGVEIEGAWEQGEKYVVPSKVRNVKIGQEGSDWIQFSTFKIYSNELSAETVANLPKV
jgi:hypothetical protein